jgi:hypothetical protein
MDGASHRQRRESWTTRLVSGGIRKTRLHDELGAPVSLSRALRNGPRALGTGLLRLVFGYRPSLPWISYDAQRILGRFLDSGTEVLEFGSGMSTLWYARHAGHVVSIEDDRTWYDKVGARLSAVGNIEYRFAPDPDAYVGLAPDKLYDLIMIDGSWREDCARFAVRHLKPGGIIYLDNSDKGPNMQVTGDIPKARAFLIEFARNEGLPCHEITDFAPTQLFVQRGLMVGGASGRPSFRRLHRRQFPLDGGFDVRCEGPVTGHGRMDGVAESVGAQALHAVETAPVARLRECAFHPVACLIGLEPV